MKMSAKADAAVRRGRHVCNVKCALMTHRRWLHLPILKKIESSMPVNLHNGYHCGDAEKNYDSSIVSVYYRAQ